MPAVYVGRKTHCIVMAVPNVEGGGVETNKNKKLPGDMQERPKPEPWKRIYCIHIYIYKRGREALFQSSSSSTKTKPARSGLEENGSLSLHLSAFSGLSFCPFSQPGRAGEGLWARSCCLLPSIANALRRKARRMRRGEWL